MYAVDGNAIFVIPYFQQRETTVKKRWLRRRLIDVLKEEFTSPIESGWDDCIKLGYVKSNDAIANGEEILGPRSRITTTVHRHEPAILYNTLKVVGFRALGDKCLQFQSCSLAEADVLLVNKPASWPTLPSGAYNRNTMYFMLQTAIDIGILKTDSVSCEVDVGQLTNMVAEYSSESPGSPLSSQLHVLHRLDRQVSGAVLVARHSITAQRIQAWFELQSTTHACASYRRSLQLFPSSSGYDAFSNNNNISAMENTDAEQSQQADDRHDHSLGKMYIARLHGDIRIHSTHLQSSDDSFTWESILNWTTDSMVEKQSSLGKDGDSKMNRATETAFDSVPSTDINTFRNELVECPNAELIDVIDEFTPSSPDTIDSQWKMNLRQTYRVGNYIGSEVSLTTFSSPTSLFETMNWHPETINRIVNSISQQSATKSSGDSVSSSASCNEMSRSNLAWCPISTIEIAFPLARYANNLKKYAAKRVRTLCGQADAKSEINIHIEVPHNISSDTWNTLWRPLFFDDDPILRAESIPSKTKIVPLCYDPSSNSSLVLLQPVTGRTHQLRIHVAALGNPIVFDMDYGYPYFPSDLPHCLHPALGTSLIDNILCLPTIPTPIFAKQLLIDVFDLPEHTNLTSLIEACPHCNVLRRHSDCISDLCNLQKHNAIVQSGPDFNNIPKKYACILLHSMGFISSNYQLRVNLPSWFTIKSYSYS